MYFLNKCMDISGYGCIIIQLIKFNDTQLLKYICKAHA